MTENNSTPSTLELPFPVSPSIPYVPKNRVVVETMIRVPGYAKKTRQNTKATTRQIMGKSRVGRDFNLKWPNGRWYRMVVTSMSDTSAFVDTEVYVASLRGLMLNVVDQVGKMNRHHAARHFSITLSQQPRKAVMHTESIPIMEGHAITPTALPITDHEPIDKGLVL